MIFEHLFLRLSSVKYSINVTILKYNRILLGHNSAICSNMDTTRDYHTKWSKSEKKKDLPYDITYIWNLKYGTNGAIYKTETDSQT